MIPLVNEYPSVYGMPANPEINESPERPIGKLFTDVYMERGAPVRDSEAFRHRIGSYFNIKHSDKKSDFYNHIKTETGDTIRISSNYYCLEEYFVELPLPKLLNAITLTYRFIFDAKPKLAAVAGGWVNVSSEAEEWRRFVARALREENLGYVVDQKCGVHFLEDEEFERNRASALACLQKKRYGAVLDAYETAHRHLDATPPDTKAAVRSMFEALEILVRLFIDTKNLNKWVVENKLKPAALARCGDDAVTRHAVEGIYDALRQWVDTLHIYRHGQPTQVPVPPSRELAVFVLSSGAGYLRQLIELDPGGEPA
jgi:hypothetical protein